MFHFRLEPPQPPLIEIEDTANSITRVEKRLGRETSIEKASFVIPTRIPESLTIHDFPIPSADLQQPEVDVKDAVNASKCGQKNLEELSALSLPCNVTIPETSSAGLITSSRSSLVLCPPEGPPTDLSDKPNSISGCKKISPEIFSTSVQYLQPKSYADALLRKQNVELWNGKHILLNQNWQSKNIRLYLIF